METKAWEKVLWTTVWKCGFLVESRKFFTVSTELSTEALWTFSAEIAGDRTFRRENYVDKKERLRSTRHGEIRKKVRETAADAAQDASEGCAA